MYVYCRSLAIKIYYRGMFMLKGNGSSTLGLNFPPYLLEPVPSCPFHWVAVSRSRLHPPYRKIPVVSPGLTQQRKGLSPESRSFEIRFKVKKS